MTRVILGLGSNVGDRAGMLQKAIAALQTDGMIRHLRASSYYESKAMLPEDAPDEWNLPYLNMAIAGDSETLPQAMLMAIKKIERTLGRMDRGRWGPREIDIDILGYGNTVIDSVELTIPHRELLHRDFALIPMAEIASDWTYPAPGEHHGATSFSLAERYHASSSLIRLSA